MDTLPPNPPDTKSSEISPSPIPQVKHQIPKLLILTIVLFPITILLAGIYLTKGFFSRKVVTNNGEVTTSNIQITTAMPTIDSKNVIQVKGNSMMPNFKNNEYYLVDRFYHKANSVQRGDVILFTRNQGSNGRPIENIKRVIGLPTETVQISNGHIYISDNLLPEPYLLPDTLTNTFMGALIKEGVSVTIPPDQYFVLGDNRRFSSDSREWGFLPKEDMLGKILNRIDNYIPPTYTPEEKMLIEKYDLVDAVSQKIELLKSVKDFCGSLTSMQAPDLICVINNKESCNIKDMNNDQLKNINLLSETAINDCVKYQSEVNAKKTK